MTTAATATTPHEDQDAPPTHAPAALPREQVIRARKGIVGVDWRELIRHRELLGFLIWRDMKVRYKQTVLGVGWAVLQPLCFMAIFTVIGAVAKIDTGGVPRPIFYFAGLLPWSFYAVGLQFSSQSLVNQQHLLTKIYLPRLFIPTSVIVTGLVDMAVAFCVLAIIITGYSVAGTPTSIGLDTLMLIPLTGILMLATFGFGFLFSSLTVPYRDIRYIVPFFVQGMMFLSPVIYPVSFLPEKYAWILALNPMTAVIEGFRSAFTDAPWHYSQLAIGTTSAIIIFTVGLMVFRQIERRFADIA